jgi:hypothetical protein
VADHDPNAAGLLLARELGIFTTSEDRELCAIEELDLLLELTPDDSLEQRLRAEKPPASCWWIISMRWPSSIIFASKQKNRVDGQNPN